MIDAPDLGVKLYIMPKVPYALRDILPSDSFPIDIKGFRSIKRWLSDIFGGLKHLHNNGFAYLDIKKDNVLISADDRALLCDFTGLNLTRVSLEKMVAPLIFHPPECYEDLTVKI